MAANAGFIAYTLIRSLRRGESWSAAIPDGYGLFFFQAEDGIRDLTVTGVQTCALPISAAVLAAHDGLRPGRVERPQHLDLLVPHRLGREVDRRLHRRQREQLEQVVLEDVEIGRASCRERV